MTTHRPYRITVIDYKGFSIWAGRRTVAYATVDAARSAAFKLAAELAETTPNSVTVNISEMSTANRNHGPVIEQIEVVRS